MRCVLRFPRVRPSTLMNSVTINPTPPSSLINRRNGESVTPAMGASTRFGRIATLPSDVELGAHKSE